MYVSMCSLKSCFCVPLSVQVHNDFLLAILTRCQIIVSTPGKVLRHHEKCFIVILDSQRENLRYESFASSSVHTGAILMLFSSLVMFFRGSLSAVDRRVCLQAWEAKRKEEVFICSSEI